MKKNISINIGGIIFHIEEDGYEKLKNYLDSINRYFSTFEDSKEIIEDIEGRIAEIFLARLDDGKQVINHEDVDELIGIMGTTKDFDAQIETEPEVEEPEPEKKEEGEAGEQPKSDERRLYRDSKRKVIGGVASGLAHYFGIDPIWVRLILIATLILWFLGGFVLIAYIVLWIAVPASNQLEEDKKVKKLYRDSEDSVLGGVSSGLASYFGVDKVLIRVLFVVSIFLGGAGLIAYIILWIITPEAKSITEKMQMQGEPVTISNIEQNVKRGLNVEEGEENLFVRILLFPFRLIAIVFKALGELLGPLLRFAVEALRVILGVFLVILGFAMMICFSVTLAVLLGIGGAMEGLIHFGEFPVEYVANSFSTISLISAYIFTMVPSLGIALIGLSVIMRKAVVKAFVGWTLFALWIIGMIGLAFSVPQLVRDFTAESDVKEERIFEATAGVPTLKLRDVYDEWDYDYRYKAIDLRLRGHSDSTYLLVLNTESRGPSRAKAKEYARAIEYNVEQDGGDFYFDSDITFPEGTAFRFQNINAIFYIPYGQTFKMDGDLEEILINTLHLNGYRSYQMEGNDWVFDEDGINCLTCSPRGRGSSSRYERRGDRSERSSNRNSDRQSFDFSDFDEVKLVTLFDFEIRQGDDYSVELRGESRELRKVSVEQSGDELEINYRTKWKWWDEDRRKRKIKVFIEMPRLENLEISGACEGEVVGFDEEDISFRLAGASELDADLSADYAYADLTGASELTLLGKGENLEADVYGASELDAYGYEADDVEVKASGASTVKIFANRELDAEASGASTVRYRGNPVVSSDSKGLSSIRKD